MTHGQCDARPTVTFPAAGHHRPSTGTKLYCLVTEAHVCEQLAHGCYLKVERPGVEPATFCVASQHPNHLYHRATCCGLVIIIRTTRSTLDSAPRCRHESCKRCSQLPVPAQAREINNCNRHRLYWHIQVACLHDIGAIKGCRRTLAYVVRPAHQT